MSNETPYPPRPHPYLTEPLIYVVGVPISLSDADLASAFEYCRPFKPTIPRDGPGPYVDGTIEFRELDTAEKALATLSGRAIPGILPPVYLNLSPTSPSQPPPPHRPSATPRLVKQLPPGFTDAQLYEIFRPYGPIGSAHMQVQNQNDSGVIEFWNEDDAKVAEEAMHCAEVDGYNIAVQVYHPPPVNPHTPRRAGSEGFNATAQPFVPSGSVVGGFGAPPLPSSPHGSPYSQSRQPPFIHGPGQQVQYAPAHGPGSNSHSGLIDPCNLFCKNLDPEIDSNALFTHFRNFGQIVSARVMRDDNGRSRGFGFVSFQAPDQAAYAMRAMNGVLLGSKQLIVRLHEPKQLRQEKLAQRFGGHNGHPRSRSGATSPAASEAGDSHTLVSGWSPHGSFAPLASPTSPHVHERQRRSSGSYYHAALAGHLNMPLTLEDLSALTPVVRREVLSGELQRRVRAIQNVPSTDVEGIVESIIGLSLNEVVEGLHDAEKLTEQVQSIQQAKLPQEEKVTLPAPSQQPATAPQSKSSSPSPAESSQSQDSRLLDPNALNATASAPEHPSTPVSVSVSLSEPPRTSSPSGSVNPVSTSATERERIRAAVTKLEPARGDEITELIMSLSKRERAMCLFNVEVLRAKVADAKLVLDSDEGDEEPAPASQPQPAAAAPAATSTAPVEPVTPVMRRVSAAVQDSPTTPDLSSRGPSATGSPVLPSTPSSTTHTIASLARMPAAQIIDLARSSSATGLPLPKADPAIVKATDDFIDSLADQSIAKQKQQVGDKLFRSIKSFGIKGAPKVTIALLDQDDLRALAHLMNSYPAVLKEKAILTQSAISSK